MATADEQVIVDGQRAVAVQQQEGPLIYSGGTTDVQCIVSTSDGPQRAIKVYNVGGWTPEGQTTAYLVQQLLMDKYQTQEVVDATDLVRNTADLNPFILDLSGNTILKKLTATGTDEKVETGLQGVLVSNEAPFDSSISPQINVNYTGLNRTALQNLFKSMPYNVGYTLVGSPTISNGVVSGFASSDSIDVRTIIPFGTADSWEIGTAFIRESTSGIHGLIDFSTSQDGVQIFSPDSRLVFVIGGTNFLEAKTFKPDINVKYYIRVQFTGTEYVIEQKKESETSWTEVLRESNSTKIGNSTIYNQNIGNSHRYALARPWNGSIYLNETYIKVNGAPWFRGTAAMTKTCSIVGCAGTADLTAADKAIVEDKGWELVLS